MYVFDFGVAQDHHWNQLLLKWIYVLRLILTMATAISLPTYQFYTFYANFLKNKSIKMNPQIANTPLSTQ